MKATDPKTYTRGLWVLAAGCALVPLLIFPLGWKEQLAIGTALIAAAIVLSGASGSARVTLALMTLSMFSSLRYGYWRTTQTWDGMTSAGHLYQWDTIVVLLLLFAEGYAIITLGLGYFQTLRPLRRPCVPLEGLPATWPSVDVLIPTYNEPLAVVRATVLGALAIDYPAAKKHVFILDDGRRREFRDFAAHVGAGYIARGDNVHAKAGNLNHALSLTSGDYIAIFDADHVPTRSFLQATLGWFSRDARLGLVQTPHHFYSADPFERNLGQFRKVPSEGELFHRLVQDGNDLWNASFFCGSCAVMRRQALEQIGGIAVETVTEDAHTALRMQRRGWNTAYINTPQAAGLATESLAAHIGQRIRWARGMVQTLRIENPLTGSGLSLSQRLCYLNATTHFLFAVPRLVFLTVPLTYLLFGIVNIYGYSLAVFAYAFPHLALSHLTNSRIQKGHRSSFWNEIYETVLAPYILVPTVLALINPRFGRFNVTGKGGVIDRSYFDHRVALPFVFLLGINLAGLVMAGHRYATDPAHRDTVVINAAWTIYNIVLLLVAASVAREKSQRRATVRVDVRLPMTLETTDGRRFAGAATQLSAGGALAQFESCVMLPRSAIVKLVFDNDGSPCKIDARLVHARHQKAHLQFTRLELSQEQFLVNAMYARPETWLAWETTRRAHSPASSLVRILWLSLRGVGVVGFGLLTPPRRRPRIDRSDKTKAAAVSLFILAVLAGALSPVDASAQQASGTPAGTGESSVFVDNYELSAIAAQKFGTMEAAGASLNYFFGVPATKIITGATLSVRYAAPLLTPNAARLELSLNGRPIGAIDLLRGTDQRAEVPLPTDVLTTDNRLSFRLEGLCQACEASRAPWVTIDPQSRIAIRGTALPLANDLGLLPLPFFDPAAQRPWQLPVVFSERPDFASVEAAAIVASWFGVASDVRNVRFPVSTGALPAGHAIVIARRGSVFEPLLGLPSISGPLIAIRDNPRDRYGKLLIVAADRPEELLTAARALVTHDHSLRHTDVVSVPHLVVQPRRRYTAPRWLDLDAAAPIGMYTSTERMKLIGSGSINIYFRLPPDLFLSARSSVPLRLKYGYQGVSQRSRATLYVRLNAKDVDSIRLRAAPGPIEEARIVRIPTDMMRPYANTLTVDVDFEGQRPPTNESQSFAIRRESSLDLRGIPHSVVLPRLDLFVEAGYPFTQWPDLSRTAIVLSNAPTPSEYELLLNMVAFFGAQTGSPATAIAVTDAEHVGVSRDKDIIVLGARESQRLLSQWATSMALDLSSAEVRVARHGTSGAWRNLIWWNDDLDNLQRLLERERRFDLVVQQFASPFRSDRSVVAIAIGADAAGSAAALFNLERNGEVRGDVAVAWRDQFHAFQLRNSTYRSGDISRPQRIRVLLLEHYWLMPLAIMLFALIIGSWLHDGTERVAERRLRSNAETE